MEPQIASAPPRAEPQVLPLFGAYPELHATLPHVNLGTFPTPLQELTHLGNELRIGRLYIKRDDLTGAVYGGNKVRKLEFLLGNALKDKAKEVVTIGFAGSNHAVATAIYGRELGLKVSLLLLPQANAHYVRRNLLGDRHFGASLFPCSSTFVLSLRMLKILLKTKLMLRPSPIMIPPGGSNPLGVTGYVNAVFELKTQIDAKEMAEPDLIYVALGSAGTAVGLALGLKALGLKTRVVPVRVIEESRTPLIKVHSLFRDANRYLRRLAPAFPELGLCPQEIAVRGEFMGKGYAQFTEQGVEAAALIARETGLTMNGAYSAKAFAALVADARSGMLKEKTVLFWNTYNSRDLSGFVRQSDYHELPKPFWKYFEEDVQPADKTGSEIIC